jgi:hypothetical protein
MPQPEVGALSLNAALSCSSCAGFEDKPAKMPRVVLRTTPEPSTTSRGSPHDLVKMWLEHLADLESDIDDGIKQKLKRFSEPQHIAHDAWLAEEKLKILHEKGRWQQIWDSFRKFYYRRHRVHLPAAVGSPFHFASPEHKLQVLQEYAIHLESTITRLDDDRRLIAATEGLSSADAAARYRRLGDYIEVAERQLEKTLDKVGRLWNIGIGALYVDELHSLQTCWILSSRETHGKNRANHHASDDNLLRGENCSAREEDPGASAETLWQSEGDDIEVNESGDEEVGWLPNGKSVPNLTGEVKLEGFQHREADTSCAATTASWLLPEEPNPWL